jgi:hypothetical protein
MCGSGSLQGEEAKTESVECVSKGLIDRLGGISGALRGVQPRFLVCARASVRPGKRLAV